MVEKNAGEATLPLAIKTPSASSSARIGQQTSQHLLPSRDAERSRHERVHHEESEDQSAIQASASKTSLQKTLDAAIVGLAAETSGIKANRIDASESNATESKASKSKATESRANAINASEFKTSEFKASDSKASEFNASESKTTRSLAASQKLDQSSSLLLSQSGVSKKSSAAAAKPTAGQIVVGDAVLEAPSAPGRARDPQQVAEFLHKAFDEMERSGIGKRPSTLPPRPDSLATSSHVEKSATTSSVTDPAAEPVVATAVQTSADATAEMYVYVETESDSFDARPRIFKAVRCAPTGGSGETYKLLPLQIESFDEEQIAYHNKKPIRRVLRGLHVAPIEYARTLGMRRTSAFEGRLEERKEVSTARAQKDDVEAAASSAAVSQPVHGVARIVSSLEHLERCLFYEADNNQCWKVRWSFSQ